MAFPILAVGWAAHDDLLFVRLAAEIGMGHWLGNYNELTHAKGVGYPLFLLLNHATALPLKFSEHALYLASAAFFAHTAGQMLRSRPLALVLFAVVAFQPAAWLEQSGGRVMREGIYVSQTLLLLTLGLRCWVLAATQALPATQLRAQWRPLLAMGLVGGWFWLTREEGVWLLPALTLLLAYWLWAQRHALRRQWRAALAFAALPIAVATVMVGAVNTTNYAVYGVFRNNDFRSSDFLGGYGALTRIRHDHWQRYVPFPKDARERAYAMSAAARELKPYFEGDGGEFWRQGGCAQTQTSPCPEILSGWFMWALRRAVATTGHYQSAQEAQSFYRRLAAEIDAGCRQHPDDCLPPRATMVPPWHEGYALDAIKASGQVFWTLATLDHATLKPYHSVGQPLHLRLFEVVTNGPIAPMADTPPLEVDLTSPRDTFRLQLAQWIATAMSKASAVALPMAFALWSLWTVVLIVRRRMPDVTWMLAASLAAALATRIALLGFLEATSIPSNYILYLYPAVPLSLAFPVVVLWSVAQRLKSRKNSGHNAATA
ncbi:hypothetical protein [Comamonas odontotermitis]|uniref:hypothetical protein n=1 Tax=Comamonas odontotermitis TaxID=379895 RepID=UPI003750BD7C